jgi:chemotaxis protein CheD
MTQEIMGAVIKVGMADLKTGSSPDILTTLGLGSCVGIALWDPVTKIGGLAHVMLPDSTKIKNHSNIAKFADTGIEELVRQMEKQGVPRRRMVAKLAGGARMFEISGTSSVGNIGEKNAEASRDKLRELHIPVLAEDTGQNYGRTVELDCANGDYVIKSVGKAQKII